MPTTTASAPGKLMLFGDHAVLYGQPCLVTAVDLRIQVSVVLTNQSEVVIKGEALAKPVILSTEVLATQKTLPKAVRFVGLAVKQFWQHVGETFGVTLTTRSEFTQTYGLGSSSAVTVATIKALSIATNIDLSNEQIFELSYAAVLEAQTGRASGFDVASATYGGTLYYEIGKPVQPLAIQPLPLVIGYSGIKAGTVNLVNQVAQLNDRYPQHITAIMANIGLLVDSARLALTQGDYPTLGQMMKFNQGYLQALGVSTSQLDTLIQGTQDQGAYGAKLSGAGGGDCMIALVDNASRPKVEKFLEQSRLPGVKQIQAHTNAEGVRGE